MFSEYCFISYTGRLFFWWIFYCLPTRLTLISSVWSAFNGRDKSSLWFFRVFTSVIKARVFAIVLIVIKGLTLLPLVWRTMTLFAVESFVCESCLKFESWSQTKAAYLKPISFRFSLFNFELQTVTQLFGRKTWPGRKPVILCMCRCNTLGCSHLLWTLID